MKNNDEIPVLVYHSVIQVREGGMQMEFDIVDCEFRSSEVEEVAVEHLLRDVQQHKSVTTLEKEVEHKVTGLRGLKKRLNDIKTYLEKVESKQLPLNQEILHNIQNYLQLEVSVMHPKLFRSNASADKRPCSCRLHSFIDKDNPYFG
eukprot:TRINITY_DN5777_c0_g2_i1.p1 TRINITY_DN5777_c0_g2~~TRINITY_DN5777_c0_g2_i1.p1  ORF type:complete len:163 (-),score=43.65 TRINITY_DN5777_c0_g2_i1:217-657(-)